MARGFTYKTTDILNKKFNRLCVIEDLGVVNGRRRVKAVCECGIVCNVRLENLISGESKSCGCFKFDSMVKTFTKHGLYLHPILTTWKGMMRRCYNKKSKGYINYGGNGVEVCEEWKDFLIFSEWAFKNGWQKGLQLDKDKLAPGKTGKLYCHEYCCFLTCKENSQYKSNNRVLGYNGENLNISQLCIKFNINRGTFQKRLKLGWPIEKIITQPIDKKFSTKKKIAA